MKTRWTRWLHHDRDILPYDAVRRSADPDSLLLAFLQETYAADADLAGWDRQALERSSVADTAE
jgi:hypothetical protein